MSIRKNQHEYLLRRVLDGECADVAVRPGEREHKEHVPKVVGEQRFGVDTWLRVTKAEEKEEDGAR